MPAVSVIMPAFNAAAHLHGAVASVLRQSVRDLELLVIDDGSTDDTPAIVRQYARADGRIRLLAQANAGPGPARNTGFHAARAPVFAFLDSDDEWDSTFLEEQLSILARRPDVDVVVGNARLRGGRRDGEPARPVRGAGQPITLAEILADERALFIMSVFRRRAVETIGGFDPSIFTNEEYEMWIRAAAAGVTFTRNPKPLGWYAVRAGSLSSNDTRMLAGILQVFAKARPRLAPGSPERTILERQVVRFESELAAAEARSSLARGDYRSAARHLDALHARRGGWLVRLGASVPRGAAAAYRLRRAVAAAPAPGTRRRLQTKRGFA